MRILLPIRETRRDVGRGLSKTNLESKHSCRMKLLWRKRASFKTSPCAELHCEGSRDLPQQPGVSSQSGDGDADVVVDMEDLLLVGGQFRLSSLRENKRSVCHHTP